MRVEVLQKVTEKSSTSIEFDLKVDYKMIAIVETKGKRGKETEEALVSI